MQCSILNKTMFNAQKRNHYCHLPVLPFPLSFWCSRSNKTTNIAMTATVGITIAARSAPVIFFRFDPQSVPLAHIFALLPTLLISKSTQLFTLVMCFHGIPDKEICLTEMVLKGTSISMNIQVSIRSNC